MNRIFLAAAFAILGSCAALADTATPAPATAKAAAPKAPEKPACGTTVADCQKLVDSLTAQLGAEVILYTGARQQRDQAQQALSDAKLDAFLASQTAPPK